MGKLGAMLMVIDGMKKHKKEGIIPLSLLILSSKSFDSVDCSIA